MSNAFKLDEAAQSAADYRRTCRAMLRDMREETWGWVVYRTTYQSDPAFHKAIDVLTSWIKDEVHSDIHESGVENADPAPNDQLWARHKLTVIEDVTTPDRASIDAIWAQFEAGEKPKASGIDGPSTAEDAMTAEEHREQHGPDCPDEAAEWFVPVVEAFPELDVGDPDYEGWMNCSITTLVRLWNAMGDGSYMAYAYATVDDDDVYW